ncbi:MAG: hypothetical protein ACFFBE_05460 [Promethearchaeota archaeon]
MNKLSNEHVVEFQNIEEFYFPKKCIVCGEETDSYIEKSEYSSYTYTKDYKKDYKFKLPLCDECNSKMNVKTGKSIMMVLLCGLIGIILGISIYYLTYTFLLSLAVFTILITFPFLKYRAISKSKIRLSKFMQMKVIPNQEFIRFTFTNREYAQYVNKINSKKIRETKENETIVETPNLNTSKKDKQHPTKKDNLDSYTTNDFIKPSTEEKRFEKEVKEPIVKDIKLETKKCSRCGSDLKPGWKFCVFCSEPIKN